MKALIVQIEFTPTCFDRFLRPLVIPFPSLFLLPRPSPPLFVQSTYALTVFRYTATIDDKSMTIDFWDTAGQERFTSMHPSYYHRAHACILVFDITRKATYTNLSTWYHELQQYRRGIPTLVVANKVDVNPRAAGKPFQFTEKHGLPKVRFCSASDGTNVVALFEDIIYLALQKKRDTAISKNLTSSLDVQVQPSNIMRAAEASGLGGAASASVATSAEVDKGRGDGDDDDAYLDEVLATLEYFEMKDTKEKGKGNEREGKVDVHSSNKTTSSSPLSSSSLSSSPLSSSSASSSTSTSSSVASVYTRAPPTQLSGS